MKWLDNRKAVAVAAAQLIATREHYREDTRWLQESLRSHRSALVVGSGLVSGMMVGWLPLRTWLRTGVAAISMGTAIARTPLGPIALGALFASRTPATETDDEN